MNDAFYCVTVFGLLCVIAGLHFSNKQDKIRSSKKLRFVKFDEKWIGILAVVSYTTGTIASLLSIGYTLWKMFS